MPRNSPPEDWASDPFRLVVVHLSIGAQFKADLPNINRFCCWKLKQNFLHFSIFWNINLEKEIMSVSSHDASSSQDVDATPPHSPFLHEHLPPPPTYNQLLPAMTSLQISRSPPSSRRSSIIPEQGLVFQW